MLKVLITTASALTLGFAANAQSSAPLEGDSDFLERAYADADVGRSFSYASQWGNGKAYDGTDTSQVFQQRAPVATVTRTVAAAPVRSVTASSAVQTYVTPVRPAPRQTQPATKPSPPVVNTLRTVTRPAPAMRGTTSARTVTRSAPLQRTYAPAQRAMPSPLGELPRAHPGECFARMKVAAQYDMVPRQIAVAAPYQRAKLTQAQFGSETKEVLVKDAHIRYVVTQPKFAVKHEQVIIKPAHDRLEVVPARFSYIAETVQVSEPRLVWKRGVGLSGVSRQDPRTGDTWCLVEEAGETRSVQKRMVSQPEQVRRVPIAAQTVSVSRQVLVQQGGIKQIDVPAEYRDFTVQRMIAPASSGSYNVPEEVDTIMTKTLRTSERFEWVEVLCDTNSGPATIRTLQSALHQRGLYHGRLDGIMGPQTRSALVKYQRSAGIRHLGYLTTDTMGSLGIS